MAEIRGGIEDLVFGQPWIEFRTDRLSIQGWPMAKRARIEMGGVRKEKITKRGGYGLERNR
jgi:hypothetical protein